MQDTLVGYLDKLKGRLYGLLCEREKGGEWRGYLDTILIEVIGLQSQLDSIDYWRFLGKVQSLRVLDYDFFRKTIFECMNMVSHLE